MTKAKNENTTSNEVSEIISVTIAETPKVNKTEKMVELLLGENGVSLQELATTLDWKVNSIRGALSAYAKKHPEYLLISEKQDGVRTFRLIQASA